MIRKCSFVRSSRNECRITTNQLCTIQNIQIGHHHLSLEVTLPYGRFCRTVGWLVFHNFLNSWEISLPFSYRSSCFILFPYVLLVATSLDLLFEYALTPERFSQLFFFMHKKRKKESNNFFLAPSLVANKKSIKQLKSHSDVSKYTV